MKTIILKQAGWENFSGNFGGIEFVGGKSAAPVQPIFAQRIANILSVETEDGVNPSSSQRVLDSRTVEWSVSPSSQSAELALSPVAEQGLKAMELESLQPLAREELEAIASEGGIHGLRKFADERQLNVKANSIIKMIDAILAAQAPAQVQVQVPAAEAEVGAEVGAEAGAEQPAAE